MEERVPTKGAVPTLVILASLTCCTPDMEETMVCTAFTTPGILQNLSRISTFASAGCQRGALGDAGLTQAT